MKVRELIEALWAFNLDDDVVVCGTLVHDVARGMEECRRFASIRPRMYQLTTGKEAVLDVGDIQV